MNGDLQDNELLRSYLLGRLAEEEAARLEGKLLEDDELFALCEAVEADLLAAYDRRELVTADEEQVGNRLASSAAGRKRLALARFLNAAAGESRQKAASVLPFGRRAAPFQQKAASVLPFGRHAVPFQRLTNRWAALAAAVLLAVIGVLWWAQPMRQQDSPPKLATNIPTPGKPAGTAAPRQTPEAPVAKAPVTQHPQTEPERSSQRDERAATKPPERSEPVKFAFALSLATLRGAEDVEEFPIPAGTELVEIQLDLEGVEGRKPYHATVRSQSNEMVWEKGGLAPKRLDWGRVIALDIPSENLPSGLYEVTLTPTGTEPLTQEFKVIREAGPSTD
jgi:hypothetical protein